MLKFIYVTQYGPSILKALKGQLALYFHHPNHQPEKPVLMSVAWSSAGRGGSVIARHERKGLSKIRGVLEDFVEKNHLQSREQYSIGPR